MLSQIQRLFKRRNKPPVIRTENSRSHERVDDTNSNVNKLIYDKDRYCSTSVPLGSPGWLPLDSKTRPGPSVPWRSSKSPFDWRFRPLSLPLQHVGSRSREPHGESRTYSTVDQSFLGGYDVTDHPIEQLTSLPQKIEHSRGSRYIGVENKGRPKFLYDSFTDQTVIAEDWMFKQGYVTVSWTWGRWRDGWHREDGTQWQVPTIVRHKSDNPVECKFKMAELKKVLRRMPDVRFFWIDVLCINQSNKGPEKDQEISKQGAIFKEAKGVLVYLWSIDDGRQLAAALRELGDIMSFYWKLPTGGPPGDDRQAVADWEDRHPHIGTLGKALRTDPWFTSLWALQETILAPASIWTARDGSFCRMHGKVLTTHEVAQRFREIDIKEEASDELESLQFDPTRHSALISLSKIDSKFVKEFLSWNEWASKGASIKTCLSPSRMGILLAASKREAKECRSLAVLAALKVGFDEKYKEDSEVAGNLNINLLNDIMRAEGGAFFDCVHSSSGPLTSMLSTTADAVLSNLTVATLCDEWILKQNGELLIPRGSLTNQSLSHEETGLLLADKTFRGGDPEMLVKESLLQKGISAEHVIFIVTGYLQPLSGKGVADSGVESEANMEHLLSIVSNDRPLPQRNSAGAQGVILITKTKDIRDKSCRWHKAGTYFSRKYRDERLEHDIIVSC